MKNLFFILILVPVVCFAQTNEANELLESGIQKYFEDKFDEALIDFNLALEKDINGSIKHKIYFERAQLKRREFNDFKGALKDYNSSIKFNPNYSRAYMYRGILYDRNIKNPKAAERDLRESIKVDPKCGICYFTLGSFHGLSENESIEYLEKGIELKIDPAYNGNLIPCIWCYQQMGARKLHQEDYEGSIETFQKIIDINQEFDLDGDGKIDETNSVGDAFLLQAIQYFHYLENNIKALERINKAIKKDSFDPDKYSLRAKIKYKNRDINGALEDHQKAKKVIPQNTDYFLMNRDEFRQYLDYFKIKNYNKIDALITLKKKLNTRNIVLKQDKDGCICLTASNEFLKIKPIKNKKNIIGAGDKFLAALVVKNNEKNFKKKLIFCNKFAIS